MSASLISPVMVGRGEQLAALRQLSDLAFAGSPAVVLLGGEAGVGKTRLITEFTAGLADRAVLLSGGCVDLGGAGLAYAPFTAALRGLVRQLGVEDVAALLPGGGPAELGRLLPALAASRPRSTDPMMTPGPPGPGCLRSSSACWRISPTGGRSCWSSRMRTGRISPAVTCCRSWYATCNRVPCC